MNEFSKYIAKEETDINKELFFKKFLAIKRQVKC